MGLPGYDQPVGAKIEFMKDLKGPASYNNTGTFSTSGQTIYASDDNLGGFEFIAAMGLSDDGLHTVLILLPGTPTDQPVPSATVHWFVQATGAEVANAVNLSTVRIRLWIRAV
jgi:hypothetical protein